MTNIELEQATEMYISAMRKNKELMEWIINNRSKDVPYGKLIYIEERVDKLKTEIKDAKEKMLKLAEKVSDDDRLEWCEKIKPYVHKE